MQKDGLAVLAGSTLTLPEAVVLDNGLNTLTQELTDLTITPTSALGTVENGVYTAGAQAGTETLLLRSDALGLEGTAQNCLYVSGLWRVCHSKSC